jgi:hypothetical protein
LSVTVTTDGYWLLLLPLSVDGLILAASLVMLLAWRRDTPLRRPWLTTREAPATVDPKSRGSGVQGLPAGWLIRV